MCLQGLAHLPLRKELSCPLDRCLQRMLWTCPCSQGWPNRGSHACLLDSWGSYCRLFPAAWRFLILLLTKVFHQGLFPQHACWDALNAVNAMVLDFLSKTKIWCDQFETLFLPPQQQNNRSSMGQKTEISHEKEVLVPCKRALYFPYLTKPYGNLQGAPDRRKALSSVCSWAAWGSKGRRSLQRRGSPCCGAAASFMAILVFPPTFFLKPLSGLTFSLVVQTFISLHSFENNGLFVEQWLSPLKKKKRKRKGQNPLSLKMKKHASPTLSSLLTHCTEG